MWTIAPPEGTLYPKLGAHRTEVIAEEIVEDLQAALDQFAAISMDLARTNESA